MTTPLDFDFWRNEQAELWQSMEGLTMAALLKGMDTAVTQLPLPLQGLVDWDFTNRAAIRFLEQYRLSTVAGISETTRLQTIEAIRQWMQSGDPLPSLVNRLTPIYGAKRAEAIAVTEVTRVFAEGNMILWEGTRVVSGKRWMTARDERVCPYCQPLDGQVVELRSDFKLSPQTMAMGDAMRGLMGDRWNPEAALMRANKMLGSVGTTAQSPPFHVRCRCWLQPFVSEELLRGQIGDMLANQFFAEVRQGKYMVSYG